MENENMTNDEVVNSEDMDKDIERDEDMDVLSLLKSSKNEEQPKEKPKTNLERMKEAKANGSLGQIVTRQDLEKGSREDEIVAKSKDEDDAINDATAYNAEQDKLIQAARNLKIEKMPTNQMEMVAMMDSLTDIANNPQALHDEKNKEFFRQKTEEDIENEAKGIAPVPTNNEGVAPVEENVIDENKQKLVNILIDKTGFGGEFKFTDDEKEKIFSATEIKLTEVEEVDLSTIKVKKSEKSFLESVNEFQISSSKVPVVFPASRFRAYMTGLSFGEMGDISLNNENITFDQVHKKLSVIYNKMIDPSIGKFNDFEDFLRKFSYVDIDLAIYGLVVATFPEVDDIPLTCNNPKCNNSFNHKFSPRTLLRFEKSDDKFLSAMQEVIDCPADKVNELLESSPTQSYKRIKLPNSKFIIEVGIASSYDYLYTIVDNLLGDKFEKEHPDDVNGILQLNSTLLGLIRTVYVPDANGEYVEFSEFEDMINALYMIKPDEVAILSSLLSKYTESYEVNFELTDIVCPHCGTVTKSIPLDINYLVFLKYQRLMSTTVNIENVSVL